ncbi:hypothetical protein AVEN_47942-1 [Araneus ventricosus]|uniref:Uncharacterized protein n=1 Tax=Araneus ventricosus TaxID=182803 RepID=A0A4Y2DP36_ARAVE|nr:hypothetical protein AVEN_47942-1 [Araneus ventricosus]
MRSLDHVQNGLVAVEPYVVVGNGHLLEGDSLGVLEEGVGSPHLLQPAEREKAVLRRHVLRQLQSVVLPALRHENVGHVRLEKIIRFHNCSRNGNTVEPRVSELGLTSVRIPGNADYPENSVKYS